MLSSIVFLILVPSPLFAQEVLRGLSVNPELVKLHQDRKNSKQLKSALAIPDSIGLPFVDDFSTTTVYPDPRLWIDKKVYINSTYPVNPVTIGVATFDALDENGYLYKNASSTPFSADTLTSRPFKLTIRDFQTDKFFFSFFYQAQGIGDKPEIGDSLMVEFYSPDSVKWKKVWPNNPGDLAWAPQGDTTRVNPFKQVIFPVSKEYQKNGFQFRFRNLASIDASNVAGKHGNVDQWHIDYVKLDTMRNEGDTILKDIAYVKPLTSLLETFQSMPWNQYTLAFRTENKPAIEVTYRNNDTEISPLIYRKFKITEIRKDNNGTVNAFDAAGNYILANTTLTLQTELFDPFSAKFPGDSVQFDVQAILSGTNDVRHENDTIHYKQGFYNYYAYDDGSSETGYGLPGDNDANAMVAYQFNAYRQDTLTGISFYFNPSEKDTTLNYPFKLAVWADNKGLPGDLIYKKSNDTVITPKKVLLNQFYNFKLDSGIIVNGKFYVGFIQETNDYLNIGFDLNNNNSKFLFVNEYGSWYGSGLKGTLMIRPVFGKVQEGPVTGQKTITSQSFAVYPNPANDLIYINPGDNASSKLLTVTVYSITGELVLSGLLQNNTLDVSQLPNGLYILKLSGGNINFQPTKLLIQR